MAFKKEEDRNEHQIYYEGQEEEIQELETEVERVKKAIELERAELKAENERQREVIERVKKAIELERAELKAENERQREMIARTASKIQALQGQLSEHETTQKDVYVGTVSSFDEAIEHHRRLPHHLRTVSVTPLHASNMDIFEFGVPRASVEELVRSLGL